MTDDQRYETWRKRRTEYWLERKAYPVCDQCLDEVMQWEPFGDNLTVVGYYFPVTTCIVCSESMPSIKEHGREPRTLTKILDDNDRQEWLLKKSAYPYSQEFAPDPS